MAIEFINAVYDLPDVSSTECAILVYLANKSNPSGESWPSRQAIAAATRFHPDTVKDTLKGLAERDTPLIMKIRRFSAGRATSNRIVLLFGPGMESGIASSSLGELNPRLNSIKDPRGQGADHPLEEPSSEPSKDSVARISNSIWLETPIESRRKSTSKPELLRALKAAKNRGHDLERIAEALRRYFRDPEHTRDDCRAMKGVHRVVENDRWEPWDPGPEWAPGATFVGVDLAAGADRSETVQVTPELVAEMQRRKARGRVEDWQRNPGLWKSDWGPAPDRPGCTIDPLILTEFGLAPADA